MDKAAVRDALPCLVLAVLMGATTFFFNGVLDAAQSPVSDDARDWATVSQVLAMVALALVSRSNPRIVRSAWISGGCIVAAALGAVLSWLGTSNADAGLLLPGVCLMAPAVSWANVVLVVRCLRLGMRSMMVALGTGSALAVPLSLALSHAGYGPVLAMYLAIVCVCIAYCTVSTRAEFESFAQATPASSAEVTSPRSVLPLTHDLFVYVFLFCLSYGFGLRYEGASGGLLANGLLAAVLLAVALYALTSKPEPRADVLFNVAFILVLAGYLLVLLNDGALLAPASIALTASSEVFVLLMELALAGIAARSCSNALPAIAWGYAAYFAGILAGAQLGIFVTGLPGELDLAARGIVAAVLGAIMVYTLFSFRDFGFDRTIATVEQPVAPRDVEVRYADSVARRCEELSAQFGLTERESDVFALLARGNNAAHIQEELSITKNTLKYHVRHIYEKAGVHSQQELIDLL